MNKLCKLLADNRRMPQRRFEIAAKDDGSEAEIFLYDAIVSDELEAEWFGGVAPQSFVKALREITASTIHLRINSPGGAVFGARAIEQALREHPANIIAHIDGLAASAATFVAMAADQVVMNKGALFMIHKAWTFATETPMSSWLADLLDKIDGTLCADVRRPHQAGSKTIEEWMAAETWFTADGGGGQWFRRQHCRGRAQGASGMEPQRLRQGALRGRLSDNTNSRPSMRQLCCAASTSLHPA